MTDARPHALADGRPVPRDQPAPPDHAGARRPGRSAGGADPRHAPRRRRRAGAGRHGRDLAGERCRSLRPPGRRPNGARARGRVPRLRSLRHRRRRHVRVRHRQARAACRGRRAGSRRRTSRSASSRAGLLKHAVTRIYFPDEAEANAADPVLSRLDEAARVDARRRRRGRRPPLRHPAAGAGPDDVLRGVTAFAPLFVPAELREAVSGRAWLAGDARCRGRPRARGRRRGRRPGRRRDGDRRGLRERRLRLGAAAAGGAAGRRSRRAARCALSSSVSGRRRPLGAPRRDDPGRDGHRGDARHPRCARPRARRARPCHRGLRASRPLAPRHADGRPHPAAAGRADDVRAQGGRLARRRPRRTSAARDSCGATGSRRSSAALPERSRRWASTGPRSRVSMPRELDLAEPTLPWHTNRVRIAELGAALEIAAGVMAKIGLDVLLLAQTEVAEVSEGGEGGGSTAMPQKRNAVGAMRARACVRARPRPRVRAHRRARPGARAGGRALAGGVGGALRRARSTPGAQRPRWRGRSTGSRSTRRGCGPTSSSPADRSPPSGSRSSSPSGSAAPRRARSCATRRSAPREHGSAAGRGARRPRNRPHAEEIQAALEPTTYLGSAGAARRSGARALRRRARERRVRLHRVLEGPADAPALVLSARSARRSRCGTRSCPRSRSDSGSCATTGAGTAARPCRRARLDRRSRPRRARAARRARARAGLVLRPLDRRRRRACGSPLNAPERVNGSRSVARGRLPPTGAVARPRRDRARRWHDGRSPTPCSAAGSPSASTPSTRMSSTPSATMLARDPDRGVRGLLRGARDVRPSSAARRDHAPTLVVTGGPTPSRRRRAAPRSPPRSPGATHVVIAGAAHIANVEQPDAFTAALLRPSGNEIGDA